MSTHKIEVGVGVKETVKSNDGNTVLTNENGKVTLWGDNHGIPTIGVEIPPGRSALSVLFGGNGDLADGGSIDKEHGSLQYINRSVRDIASLQYVGHVDPDLLPFRSTCLVPPQYGGAGLSTGNVVTLLVFAGLGYLLAKKYGDDILKRVA